MISNWREAELLRELVQNIPFQPGEDSKGRNERVGKYIGVSGKTLYNYMRDEAPGRVGLNQFLRLLNLISPIQRYETMEIVCNSIGLSLRKEIDPAETPAREKS